MRMLGYTLQVNVNPPPHCHHVRCIQEIQKKKEYTQSPSTRLTPLPTCLETDYLELVWDNFCSSKRG